MSRIQQLARPQSELLKWRMALPVLGLAICAAFYTHGVSAQPAGQKTAAHGFTRISEHNREDAYALVRDTDHGTNMSGDSADWDEIEAVKRNMNGEFLWFRDGGKTWVVQDRDILARANAAWAPVDELGKQMDAYGQQMDGHGKKMEALEHDMQRAAQASTPGMQSRASMHELGRKMHEASRPMNELGKQMGALGKRMEKESKAADKVVRQLIRQAREKGLARPAPGAA